MYTARYIRTRDGRRRRLTLGHLETWAAARRLQTDILSAADLIDAWHISGPFGERPSGIGRARRCVYARRRARWAAEWEATKVRMDAESRAWARTARRIEYFRLQPFANGSEYDWWTARNCDRCARADGCPLREAIEWAACTDGLIGNSVAGRIWKGAPEGPCSEREARRG
jgi:hypothetical protein